MSQFIQLHLLTSYPPANLNRDDLGRPKTAIMGGTQRLRISSQSLKRAWRTSEFFQKPLEGYIGTRTKQMGKIILEGLKKRGIEEEKAREWAKAIAGSFGKLKKENAKDPAQELEIEQLAHFSPEERNAIESLLDKVDKTKKAPSDEDLKTLRRNSPLSAVDIAMFGRMVADDPQFNIEAATQVAHAITVHEVAVEDDFFTAVDDLNLGEENLGAGHMGETEFAAGLFYLYVCINWDLLVQNLSGKEDLAKKALESLVKAVTMVAPSGKQSSFASRAYASYVLAEKGAQQPRSLSVAFLKAIKGKDMLSESITALEEMKKKMENVYGPCCDGCCAMNVLDGEGSLEKLAQFVRG